MAMPPFVIFEKGWMNQSLFKQWFETHFLRCILTSRPVILLMDGHSSHYCPDDCKTENNFMHITPHTTHLTQPLDKGVLHRLRWHGAKLAKSFVLIIQVELLPFMIFQPYFLKHGVCQYVSAC